MSNSMMPVYAAILAAALAVASAVYTLTPQQQAATLKERQQAYAAIMGKKHLRNQLFVSRFEAQIFSDYHERRWHLAGTPPNAIDFQEAQRWMHKSEDLALEIARSNQSMFESVGVAQTSFASSTQLAELTERIYRVKTPLIPPPIDRNDEQSLQHWNAEAVKQLQALVEREYAQLFSTTCARICDGSYDHRNA